MKLFKAADFNSKQLGSHFKNNGKTWKLAGKNLEKLHEGEEAPKQGIHPRFETGQASLEVQNRTRGINGPQKNPNVFQFKKIPGNWL